MLNTDLKGYNVMKKILVVIIMSFILILNSCNNRVTNYNLSKDIYNNAIDNDRELDESSLTEFQKLMLNDYEYMWEILRENYPFWGLIKRRQINADKVYKIYKQQINTIENEVDFFNLINAALNNFYGLGHLKLLNYNFYSYHKYIYELNFGNDNISSLGKIILAPDVKMAYESLRIEKKGLEANFEIEYNLPYENACVEDSKNIKYFDLIENKVAYIQIKSFGQENLIYDGYALKNLYEKISDYEHVIFDVSQNSGGNMQYWVNNIVIPNSENKKFTYQTYSLVQKGEYNEKFFNDNNYYYEDLKPASELPDFENLNTDDLEIAPYFLISSDTIISNTEKKALNGRLWVITSGESYSATDTFAYFCKNTGFANLIGQPTGGDGIGITSSYLKLPNSKYIIKYSADLALNNDGSNNEEFGTTPNFYISGKPGDINFINSCLKLIQNEQ